MFQKILSAIFDYHEYLVFLLLIILAFTILLMNEVPQVRTLQGEISDTFAFLEYPNIWIQQLAGLVRENQYLKEENLRLHLLNTELREAYLQNQRLRNMLDFMENSPLDILPARVINRGATSIFNSISIDVGSQEGVSPELPVISTQGIVGKTVSVGDHTSLVQIINDINFRISVKFQMSRIYGILQWNPNGLAEVREIPKTAVIHPGETVITSGYSQIYPPNLFVGDVVSIRPSPHGVYQIALIQPRVNLNSLESVFVILKDLP